MELPDWVVDDVLRPARPVAFRLVVMLFRHGRPMVGGRGERRIYWRGSLQQLARLIGADKKSVMNAERELVDVGFLTVHNANRSNAPHAISAPFDKGAGGGIFPPAAGFDGRTHDDDLDPTDQPEREKDHHHNGDERAVELFHRLAEHGVSNPRRWLNEYGVDRCAAALRSLESRRASVGNPAGYLYRLVTSPTLQRTSQTGDTFEARRARYTPSTTPLGGTYDERRARYLGHAIIAGAERDR